MCRNIRQLRQNEGLPTEEEFQLAALQFVRKISGYRTPSRANRDAFEAAVAEIAAASRKLLENLNVKREA